MRCLKSYENEQICGRVRDEVFLFGLRGFFFKIWVSKLAKTLNLVRLDPQKWGRRLVVFLELVTIDIV